MNANRPGLTDDKSPIAPRAPGRPTQDAASEIREICLDAARDLFIERGYEGASIEEIARRARAGKMTLYRQFGSKEKLFRIVAERAITTVRNRINDNDWNSTTTDYRRELYDLILGIHRGLTDPDYLAVLRLIIAERRRFPEIADIMIHHDSSLLDPIENFLRKANEKGDLKVPKLRAAAWQLAGLASGGVRFLVNDHNLDDAQQEKWARNAWRLCYNAWRPDRPDDCDLDEPQSP